MSTLAAAARALAIAMAIAAIVDPSVPLPRTHRAVVRVSAADPATAARVSRAVETAGFTIDPTRREAATVVVADGREPAISSAAKTWFLDPAPPVPNVRITRAGAAAERLPAQALEVQVTLEAAGVNGQAADVVLEDAGVPVASTRHQWTADREQWTAQLQYLPPSPRGGRLRARVRELPNESSTADNIADVAVPPVRGPVRTLVVEAAVTWPALFVRRALEGESTFAVAASQRASKSLVTRAGEPPPALTRAALTPFEVAVIGGPDDLSRPDLDALRWFVEERGGVAVFVPDHRPTGAFLGLTGVGAFDGRTLETPAPIGGGLLASELAIPRDLPAAAAALATDADGNAIIFSVRRGAGAVVVSGALDAWRHRGRDDEAFARFWRRAIASAAATVPRALEVNVEPGLARPGDRVAITVRVRATELAPGADRIELTGVAARAVAPQTHTDEAIRLWPTAEPGVFAGEWRAAAAGACNISVTAGALRGDAALTIASDVVTASPPSSAELAALARAAGGRAMPASRLADLTREMAAAFPPARVFTRSPVMRSPWWCVPFAALLCAEWALRRKRGLS